MAKLLLESDQARRYPADLNVDFSAVTMFPAVGYDEELVRSYLKHFFAEASSYREFEPYIDATYLKHLFAETKVELRPRRPGAVGVAVAAGTVQAIQGTDRHRFRPHEQDRFRGRRAGEARSVRQERAVADRQGVRDQHAERLSHDAAGDRYRHQSRRARRELGESASVFRSRRCGACPGSFEFPELNKPGVYVIDFIGSAARAAGR